MPCQACRRRTVACLRKSAGSTRSIGIARWWVDNLGWFDDYLLVAPLVPSSLSSSLVVVKHLASVVRGDAERYLLGLLLGLLLLLCGHVQQAGISKTSAAAAVATSSPPSRGSRPLWDPDDAHCTVHAVHAVHVE